MNDVNWSLYDSESLKFIYSESSKRMDESVKSFRENSNKGYIALAVYIGLVASSFKTIASVGITFSTFHHLVFCIGAGVAALCLRHCIFPMTLHLPGTNPANLISSYFDAKKGEEQNRELLITKIIDNEQAIKDNLSQVALRVQGFNLSVKVFAASILLGGVIGIFTMCNNRVICDWPFN